MGKGAEWRERGPRRVGWAAAVAAARNPVELNARSISADCFESPGIAMRIEQLEGCCRGHARLCWLAPQLEADEGQG